MQRTVVEAYTFKDGLILPAEILVNVTSLHHSMDQNPPGVDACTLEPWLWAKRRQHSIPVTFSLP